MLKIEVLKIWLRKVKVLGHIVVKIKILKNLCRINWTINKCKELAIK